jgi:hypothetical protein
MTAKVLDFWRAKAKRLVNRKLTEYGELPNAVIADLIWVTINSQKAALVHWENIQVIAKDHERLKQIADLAVAEGNGVISALETLLGEYAFHDDFTPCSSI